MSSAPRCWLLVIGGATLVIVAAITAWFACHPCVREQSYACTRNVCRYWQPIRIGKNTVLQCSHWVVVTDTCTTCIERK